MPALVHQLEAQIKLDQATIDNARAILSYTDVVAPIAGRTGIRLVDEGNLVRAADSNGIVMLTHQLGGFLAMGLGLLVLVGAVGVKWVYGTSLVRNPLLLLSVMLELVGVQLLSMGLLGELLCRTYFESQGKASYAVRDTLNLEPPARRRVA